jgi:hypothetical protein
MKTAEERLMSFCWMRDFNYSSLKDYAVAFQITVVPDEEQYRTYCKTHNKMMVDYYTKEQEL